MIGDLFILAAALLFVAYGSLTVRRILERREQERRGVGWRHSSWRPQR